MPSTTRPPPSTSATHPDGCAGIRHRGSAPAWTGRPGDGVIRALPPRSLRVAARGDPRTVVAGAMTGSDAGITRGSRIARHADGLPQHCRGRPSVCLRADDSQHSAPRPAPLEPRIRAGALLHDQRRGWHHFVHIPRPASLKVRCATGWASADVGGGCANEILDSSPRTFPMVRQLSGVCGVVDVSYRVYGLICELDELRLVGQ
jgi:hypothetical protein